MSMRYTGKWKMNKAAGRRYGSGISMVSQIIERKKVQRRRELKEKMQETINNSNLNVVCGRW